MASGTKRAWKLQEFVAHGANVNCLALGHKSGRVLVTGGDDKKVNLWAVGKPNCIMSLCGHTTPVECVRFGHTEELVCAGSQSGALKIWDLEAARLVRTLTGHKAGIKCIDFHPYGDFVSSGSTDTNLKLWDIRRKGCIFTYKGHSQTINSLKFSPDGQWIASAGEEGAVKIWDLRAGKLMNEFHDHGGPVHDVEFHPHEFLLASASHDRTVNFWDLESFQLIATTERDTGPVRTITFHPDGDCLFSGSHDALKVHSWEPTSVCDNLLMGWGKVKDIAIASTQLIGAAHQMSNVSLYVVDLKRVKPFATIRQITTPNPTTGMISASANNNNNNGHNNQNQNFRHGQSVRRSFIKEKPGANGSRPSPQVKVSEEHTSDRSGTDPEDSDNYSQADINDYQNYEHIFRPRHRELSRTPPPPDEPFQAPSGSESELNPLPSRPHDLRLKAKKPSPGPTRRSSQPVMPAACESSTSSGSVNRTVIRTRRGSNAGAAPTTTTTRPASVYDSPPVLYENGKTTVQMGGRNGEFSPGSPVQRGQRSTSVQPRSSAQLDYPRNGSEEFPQPMQVVETNTTPGRASSLTRVHHQQQHQQPPSQPQQFTPLAPVSRIQITNDNNNYRPLDRPTLVRPSRTSSSNGGGRLEPPSIIQQQQQQSEPHLPLPVQLPHVQYPIQEYHQRIPYQPPQQQQPSQQQPLPPSIEVLQQAPLIQNFGRQPQQQQQQQQMMMMPPPNRTPDLPMNLKRQQPTAKVESTGGGGSGESTTPEKEKFEVVPMNADKPSGLDLEDFLPTKKFSSLSFVDNHVSGNVGIGGNGTSKFSAYERYNQQPSELSESEVTSSILKGHDSMMSVLTARGRKLEIIQKMWQSKDAKTAVEQAVSLGDEAIIVDLLSVITLRPSIWNLDLCTALLPSIGDLLQSKYEMYINVGCAAMKLILKNFASVIKTNIDSPVQNLGVDISREERHNKCMQCYKDLVKIRALILKRQTMQGKLGHTYRELSILMQYLD